MYLLSEQPILPTQPRTCVSLIAHATRMLTAGNDTPQRHSVPIQFAQRGDVLFVSADVASPPDITEIEQLSEQRNLDVVLGRYDAAATLPLKVACGVRLWWRMLWHSDYLPFLPDGDDQIVFVAEDAAIGMHFQIEEGRLEACDWLPYANAAERSAGLERAATRIRRLVEGI